MGGTSTTRAARGLAVTVAVPPRGGKQPGA